MFRRPAFPASAASVFITLARFIIAITTLYERLKSSFGSRSRIGGEVLLSGCAILDRLHLLRGFVSLLWRDQYCHSRLHGSAGIDDKRQGCSVHVARQIRNDYEVVAPKGIVVSFQTSTYSFNYLLGSFPAFRPALFEHPL